MSKPVALFNEPNRVFFELSKGKVGKDGKVTVQYGQKNLTCFFYAMKRLLTTEQIRSEHGKICSLRRKGITAAGNGSSPEILKEIEKVNIAFFKLKGLEAVQATAEFWVKKNLGERIPGFSPEILSPSQLKAYTTHYLQMPYNPLNFIREMDVAANVLMAKGHGLKEVAFKELATIHKLIDTLKQKGPLMIVGQFGSHFYRDVPAKKFTLTMEGRSLWGWQKDTPTLDDKENGHSIVVVGADVQGSKHYVYWIDPKDKNDPKDPESQKLHVSSFEAIQKRMLVVDGGVLEAVLPQLRENATAAFYNPRFAPS